MIRKVASSVGMTWVWALSGALVLGAVACNEYGIPAGPSPHREFNFLDMGDQPKMKAQRGDLRGGPSLLTPPGAIPQDFEPYPYKGQPDRAGAELKNPLPDGDAKIVERGKLMFERYCVPCHDATGAGKGLVIEKGFPAPPSLMTQKVRDWSDGRIFHVITDGQNIMPSYATQIRPRDRWAAVRWVRDLQSKQPVAPPAANAAPPVDSAAPPVDSAAPPVDSAAPPVDSAAPPVDSAAPPGSVSPPSVPGSAVPKTSSPAGSGAPAGPAPAPAPGEVK
jgi:mono/diheme cytochrome c family protein